MACNISLLKNHFESDHNIGKVKFKTLKHVSDLFLVFLLLCFQFCDIDKTFSPKSLIWFVKIMFGPESLDGKNICVK